MSDHPNMLTVLLDERGSATVLLPGDLGSFEFPPRLSIAEHPTNLKTTLKRHAEGFLLTIEGGTPSQPPNPPTTIVVQWSKVYKPKPKVKKRPKLRIPKLGHLGDPLILGAPSVKWSQIRNSGPHSFNGTVVAGGVGAVINATPGEVVTLPFEICKHFIATQPTKWAVYTVLPGPFVITHDNATGLDTWDAPSNNTWGLINGANPFFDPEGYNDNTVNADHARLFIDGQALPYLYQ